MAGSDRDTMNASKRGRVRRTTAALATVLVLALGGRAAPAAAAPVATIGVIDFYVPAPAASFEGISVERLAADDLTDQLTQAGAGRVAVVSRRRVQQAETSLGWRTGDTLRFDRLRSLAQAIGADELVLGRVARLNVGGGGDDGGPPGADASLVLQIFDAAPGRIVRSVFETASTLSGTPASFAERAVHLALLQAVPELLDGLARVP